MKRHPPLCSRYFRAPTERLGAKASQFLIRESCCLPFLGELGVVCEQVTTAIKTRGSTSAKSHGITDWIFDCFSFRSDSEKEGFE